MPPIRSRSTSGRRWRNARPRPSGPCRSPNRRRSGRRRSRPRRAGRRAARRTRAARACARASAVPPGPGRRYRRTVPRRDVPPLEREPVARRERHLLVGRTELGRRHDGPRHVREDVREREGKQEDVDTRTPPARSRSRRTYRHQRLSSVRRDPPQSRRTDTDKHETRAEREQPGVVVAGGADLERVVDGLGCPDDDPEDPEEEGDAARGAGAEAAVYPRSDEQHGERHEAAHQMVAGRHAGLRLQEVVVDDVDRDQREARHG